MFLGEAPGFSEDANGKPFDGPAGNELDSLIEDVASEVGEFSYVITNPVACIPISEKDRTETRPPSTVEVLQCMPRVVELVEILQPQLVVFLGNVAEKAWKSIGNAKWRALYKDRGKECPAMRTVKLVHPSFIVGKNCKDPDFERKRCRLNLRAAVMKMRAARSEGQW